MKALILTESMFDGDALRGGKYLGSYSCECDVVAFLGDGHFLVLKSRNGFGDTAIPIQEWGTFIQYCEEYLSDAPPKVLAFRVTIPSDLRGVRLSHPRLLPLLRAALQTRGLAPVGFRGIAGDEGSTPSSLHPQPPHPSAGSCTPVGSPAQTPPPTDHQSGSSAEDATAGQGDKDALGKAPMDKPPLGLTPRYISEEKRVGEILAAMARFTLGGFPIPQQWLTELEDLRRSALVRKFRRENGL